MSGPTPTPKPDGHVGPPLRVDRPKRTPIFSIENGSIRPRLKPSVYNQENVTEVSKNPCTSYPLSTSYLWTVRVMAAVLILIAIGSLGGSVAGLIHEDTSLVALGLAVATLTSPASAYLVSIALRSAQFSVSTDTDGLWRTVDGKQAGLVRWEKIARMRERWGHITLEDSSRRRLIRIEHQVQDFAKLYLRIIGEMALRHPSNDAPIVFRRPLLFDLLQGAVFAGMLAFLVVASSENDGTGDLKDLLALYGTGAFFLGGTVWTAFRTRFRLVIKAISLTCRRWSKAWEIPYDEIEAMDFAIVENRNPNLQLTIAHRGREIPLHDTGLQVNVLLRALVRQRPDLFGFPEDRSLREILDEPWWGGLPVDS